MNKCLPSVNLGDSGQQTRYTVLRVYFIVVVLCYVMLCCVSSMESKHLN